MQLPARNRQDYVPIIRRNDYTWPGGKRPAVYFCNNLEPDYVLSSAGVQPCGLVSGQWELDARPAETVVFRTGRCRIVDGTALGRRRQSAPTHKTARWALVALE